MIGIEFMTQLDFLHVKNSFYQIHRISDFTAPKNNNMFMDVVNYDPLRL